MSIQANPPTRPRRLFNGLDDERSTYERLKPDLLV